MKLFCKLLRLILVLPSVGSAAISGIGEETTGAISEQSSEQASVITPEERGIMYEALEYYHAGNFADAERALEMAISKFPGSYDIRYLYSAVLVQLKQYARAREIFEWLLSRNAKDFRVLNNYAWLLATSTEPEMRDARRALALAQEAILQAPDTSSVWNTLAEAHYANANFDRAVKAMEHALDLAAREPESAAKTAEYRAQLGKMTRAAEVMQLLE